jgi:hypothetical protein
VIRRGNIMRDGVQTASIYPFSTQKIFAPLPFCKWLKRKKIPTNHPPSRIQIPDFGKPLQPDFD